MNRVGIRYRNFKKKHQGIAEFIMFTLLSQVTTIVDFATFILCNYVIFKGFKSVGFTWGLFDYRVENGGLCALYSLAISFIVSQTVNFFIQRKGTFEANNNVVRSAVIYIIMVVCVFFLLLYLPTLVREPLANAVGANWADLIVKWMNTMISFAIQFPMNKYVIMRKDEKIISL